MQTIEAETIPARYTRATPITTVPANVDGLSTRYGCRDRLSPDVDNSTAGCGQVWGTGDSGVYVHLENADNRASWPWTTWDAELTTCRCQIGHSWLVRRCGQLVSRLISRVPGVWTGETALIPTIHTLYSQLRKTHKEMRKELERDPVAGIIL